MKPLNKLQKIDIYGCPVYERHVYLFTVMLNKAKTSRPRPELRGRGQFLEVEAKAEAKNNYQKVLNND